MQISYPGPANRLISQYEMPKHLCDRLKHALKQRPLIGIP